MQEITFKAESELQLFIMIDNYLKGFIENNGGLDLLQKNVKRLKQNDVRKRFLIHNPLNTMLTSNTRKYKYYPFGKAYAILDVDVDLYSSENLIRVLLKGDNEIDSWHFIKHFTGLNSYD